MDTIEQAIKQLEEMKREYRKSLEQIADNIIEYKKGSEND